MRHVLKKTVVTALCVSALSLGFIATEGNAQACNKKSCAGHPKHNKKKCDCTECKGKCHEDKAAKKNAASSGEPEAAPAAPSKTE